MLAIPAAVAATAGGSEVLVPYASDGWRYAIVDPDAEPGFADPGYDDSSFADGAAAFGTPGGCVNDEAISTPWAAGDDLLVRRSVALPDDGRELRIGLALIREAEVFVNGQSVTSGFVGDEEFCPGRDDPVIVVPDDALVRGGANLIAIRARAPVASDPQFEAPSLLDVEIRLVEPPANDDRSNAVEISAVPFEDLVGAEGATLEDGEAASSDCDTMVSSVWYRFTAPTDGSFEFEGITSGGFGPDTIVVRWADGPEGPVAVQCSASGLIRPFHADAGSVHLFQVGRYQSGGPATELIGLRLDEAAPVEADFFFNPFIAEALAPVSFADSSFDPSGGQITSWAWSFGDGGTSEESHPSHRYMTPGEYDVSLTVGTDDGRTDSVTRTITVHPFSGGPVVADFIHGPSEPFAGQTTFFLDQSSDPAGMPIVDWQWSFGDGTSGTGSNPSHEFAEVGEYEVGLTVTTEDGRTASTSRTVTVIEPPDPTAAFGFWPPNPTTAVPVAFSDQSSDPIGRPVVAWAWSFGDGATSTEPFPSHRFVSAGDYTVDLTITTDDGRSATTSQVLSIAVPPDPIAGFSWSPFDPSVVDTVQFFAGGFDPAGASFVEWRWSFGDGATSSDTAPTHRFVSNGTYEVTLRVTTEDGRSAEATNSLTVATHDVTIKNLSAPRSASAGQTKTVNVDLVSRREPETVQVDLYRTTTGGEIFVGSQTVQLPNGKSTRVGFDVTFTDEDAVVGKVTFKAVATIVGFRDAIPGDNVATSPVTKIGR
jgi:PKD repeat protein